MPKSCSVTHSKMGFQARVTLGVSACNYTRSRRGFLEALAGGDAEGGHHFFSPDVINK